MKKLIRFPDIEQFRTIVKNVRDRANYHNVPLPKLTFNGSTKLHGTNSCIAQDLYTKESWCQSREQIITPENDNAGFARFIFELPFDVGKIFNIAASIYGPQKIKRGDILAIYGEWCGQGIMKGVAINQLSKRFVIFGIRIINPEAEEGSYWFSPDELVCFYNLLDRELLLIGINEVPIYSIQTISQWTLEIDFARPEIAQNRMVELTNEVEELCPVGHHFGVTGIGEGIVWRCISKWNDAEHDFKTSDLIFKVKGAKHSDTKVKKTASVDIEKVNSIREFAENVTTDHRLEKMLELTKSEGHALEPQSIPFFLKHVGNDVLKEESDTIDANGLTRKDVMSVINSIARQWFLQQIKDSPL